jgi:hypothetical protein
LQEHQHTARQARNRRQLALLCSIQPLLRSPSYSSRSNQSHLPLLLLLSMTSYDGVECKCTIAPVIAGAIVLLMVKLVKSRYYEHWQ